MTTAVAAAADPRAVFIRGLAGALEAAGVDYVLLHGGRQESDSDVDLAVSRASLPAADAILRTGACGRAVQCLHYDVPWCRYYVVLSDEPGRRYRQIDLACDPWGIGRYGAAPSVALANSCVVDGLRAPSPAAEALYLAVKRARKGHTEERDIGPLRRAYGRDPEGASRLLDRELGPAGRRLAAALAEEQRDLTAELRAVAARVAWQRRAPVALVRRAYCEMIRIRRRTARPTGLVVCLAGPDGAGKSTLAVALEREALGAFRRTVRLHHRPGLLPPPAVLLGRRPSDGTEPHGRPSSGLLGSLARLAYLYADTLAGWPARVALPCVRTGLVVLERGWLDLAVDPRRYRLSVPPSLTRVLGRLLPRPDLTLLLDAPAAAVRRRKPELPTAEIARQHRAWRELASRHPSRFAAIDATASPGAVLDEALSRIEERLAERQGDLAPASLALRCVGAPSAAGRPHVLVSVRGRPRWLLPAGLGAPGPRGAGLYRPGRTRDAVGSAAIEAVHRAGLRLGFTTLLADPERGLGPVIAEALGGREVELAAALPVDRARTGRLFLSARGGGRVVAYAKVSTSDQQRLEHEARVLALIARARPRHIVAPHILASFEWEGCSVLVLEPVRARARSDRPVREPELAALVEIASLGRDLAPAVGAGTTGIPLHGDFCAWNSAPVAADVLALWDWEEAGFGLPLEDLFHWRMQRLVHFGRGTVEALVRGALEPDAQVRELCRALAVEADVAPGALEACLRRGLARAGQDERACRLRRDALALLGSAT